MSNLHPGCRVLLLLRLVIYVSSWCVRVCWSNRHVAIIICACVSLLIPSRSKQSDLVHCPAQVPGRWVHFNKYQKESRQSHPRRAPLPERTTHNKQPTPPPAILLLSHPSTLVVLLRRPVRLLYRPAPAALPAPLIPEKAHAHARPHRPKHRQSSSSVSLVCACAPPSRRAGSQPRPPRRTEAPTACPLPLPLPLPRPSRALLSAPACLRSDRTTRPHARLPPTALADAH
jgi:hypothetical protein